jgi:hypothetical protein
MFAVQLALSFSKRAGPDRVILCTQQNYEIEASISMLNASTGEMLIEAQILFERSVYRILLEH